MTEIAGATSEPESLLWAHVDATLASARIPGQLRDDLAEELYGHLWNGWREAIGTGLDEETAAESAIRSFGGAQRLGIEMTAAYHSRLYASTIGVLMQAASGSVDRPVGLGRLQALLLIPMLGVSVAAAGEFGELTPGRAVLAALGAAAAVGMSLTAFVALARGQRWALRYAQLLVFLALAFAVDTLVTTPADTYQVPIAGLLGLFCLGPALGIDMQKWTAASRPLGKLLGPLVGLTIAAGLSLPFVAPVLPDPTQVGPGDLNLRLSASCTRDASGDVSVLDLTTEFSWDRLDLLPGGIKGGIKTLMGKGSDGDGLLYGVLPGDGPHQGEYGGAWLDPPTSDLTGATWSLANMGQVELRDNGAIVGSWQWTGPEPQLAETTQRYYYADAESVPATVLQAGHQYVLRERILPNSIGNVSTDPDPLIFVRYQHLDRFIVQAVATCERPGMGVPVAIPRVQVPT